MRKILFVYSTLSTTAMLQQTLEAYSLFWGSPALSDTLDGLLLQHSSGGKCGVDKQDFPHLITLMQIMAMTLKVQGS
jgi:hypothetical protein